jgi:hypothetical protein
MGNKDIIRVYKRVQIKQRKTIKDLRIRADELYTGVVSFVVSMQVNINTVSCIDNELRNLVSYLYACSYNNSNKERLGSILKELRG